MAIASFLVKVHLTGHQICTEAVGYKLSHQQVPISSDAEEVPGQQSDVHMDSLEHATMLVVLAASELTV